MSSYTFFGNPEVFYIDYGPDPVKAPPSLLITETITYLKKPVNCVLMGDQPEEIDRDALLKLYKRIFRE